MTPEEFMQYLEHLTKVLADSPRIVGVELQPLQAPDPAEIYVEFSDGESFTLTVEPM